MPLRRRSRHDEVGNYEGRGWCFMEGGGIAYLHGTGAGFGSTYDDNMIIPIQSTGFFHLGQAIARTYCGHIAGFEY